MVTLEEVLSSSEFIGTHHLDQTCKTYCNACRRELLYIGGLTAPASAPCAGFALPATLIVSGNTVMLCIGSSIDGTGSAVTCDSKILPMETRPREWASGRELFNSFP